MPSELFEHFVYTTHAMDHRGGKGIELWDEDDGCYYDALHYLDGRHVKMWVRSMVGFIPLFAVETLEAVDGTEYQVRYDPAESSTSLIGGNSNWRGPIWFLAHRMPGLRWRQAVRCGIL